MSNQWPIGEKAQDFNQGIDQDYIEKGRKKTIKLFLSLISFTLILSLFQDMIFFNLDSYNIMNVFFRILFEFTLFIFIYRGKPWARIILILFYASRIIFYGITLYYASHYLWHDIIIKSLLILMFSYALYFLLGDKNFLKYFSAQHQTDQLIRQSSDYQYRD